MIFAFLLAAALAVVPTVDPIEARLAARDAAIDAEWLSTTNRAALEAKIATFRTHFREKLGVPRIVRTPLNVRSFGCRDYGVFRVEKILFESAPGVFVTALVFLPDLSKYPPPYVAFTFLPGHADEGKACETYLWTAELAARNGMAVLLFDPIGQGERSQGAGFRNADEHVQLGAQAMRLGETTATYMIRDAVRAFDCLSARPDIDSSRLGVCGNSGGGTIAAFFMVADDRVRAAVPSCYLSSVREHILANGPQDAEQNFFDEQSWGFNHAALVLSAECPVLINAAIGDFFQIEGSRSTYRVVREVGARLGRSPDWYALSEAPGGHSMSKVHREQAVRFFLKHLLGVSREVVETQTTSFSRAECQVTPTGEVSKLPGFRSLYDEVKEKIVREGVSVESAAQKEKDSVLRERMGTDCRAVLTELKGSPMRGKRAVLHLGGTATDGELTAALFAEGSRYVPKPHRKGKVSYYERKGGEMLVAVELYLEGRSLVALRAAEILTLAAHLEKATGQKAVLIAEGLQTTPARFAVAADPTAFAEVAFK